MSRTIDSAMASRQSVVAAACIDMGVPPHMWIRVQQCVEFAAQLGAQPTRSTIVAAIESLGPQAKPLEPTPPKPAKEPKTQSPAAVVYYMRFGDRVKIGTTVNLERRMRAIPHDELLATEPGSYDLEKQRHRQFADDRVVGEWFNVTPALLEHIRGLA